MVKSKKVTKLNKPLINVKWFKDQIRRLDMSEREFTKALDVHQTTLAHLWAGRIKMPLHLVAKFAEKFDVTPEIIMSNAGVDIPDFVTMKAINSDENPLKDKMTDIKGSIDGSLQVNWGALNVHGPKEIPNPLVENTKIAALRFQTAGSAFDSLDGAILYYPIQKDGFDPESLGRVCLVKIRNNAKTSDFIHLIRIVKRGYEPGKHNLSLINGQLSEESVIVESAIPILLMKF